jgi:hypothetical protein
MTKFLGWTKFWPLIQPFLFWKGETIKGATDTTTMTEVISIIKDQSPSGLRGVTRGNSDKVNLPRDNSVKVNPSDEIPKNDSNNSGSHQATDFVMVQPKKDNPKENPLPSLVVASTKVRFLLPVTKGLYGTGIDPPIPQVLPRTQAHTHKQEPIPVTPELEVLTDAHKHAPKSMSTELKVHNAIIELVGDQLEQQAHQHGQPAHQHGQPAHQHVDDDWILISGRKSTQKPKTSNVWLNGTSTKLTKKLHTANAHVEHGTKKVS